MTDVLYIKFCFRSTSGAGAFDEMISEAEYFLAHPKIADTEIVSVGHPFVVVRVVLTGSVDDDGANEIVANLDYAFCVGELGMPANTELMDFSDTAMEAA